MSTFARLVVASLALLLFSPPALAAESKPLNILLFTADDLNCDSLGVYGCKVQDITPHLDRFAAEGLRFDRAHVNVAICQPCRGVLATGRYPHRSGLTGFYPTKRDVPTIMETLRDAGYLTGILGKLEHSTPKADFKWDFVHDQGALGQGRDPKKYHDYSVAFFARCRKEGKPFYFMVNSHDPHRPYHDPANPPYRGAAAEPSRIYSPGEITVPGFLPDLKGVREEMAHYFNSVRRCDDTFGATMKALKDSGLEDSTLVMFITDNGIAMPFAKCNAYFAATRTPWLVRWPGVVKAGSVDGEHFISAIDFFPTVLDALGLKPVEGVDGQSFVALLKGGKQAGRGQVFTQIDHKAGGAYVPMRCVQNAQFGYIFNAWSDGKYRYSNNNEGKAMKAMQEAARTDKEIAARVEVFRIRVPEEFYDLEADADSLHNLIDDPKYAAQVAKLRGEMEAWMVRTNDPALPAFKERNSPAALTKFRETNPQRGDIPGSDSKGKRKKAEDE